MTRTSQTSGTVAALERASDAVMAGDAAGYRLAMGEYVTAFQVEGAESQARYEAAQARRFAVVSGLLYAAVFAGVFVVGWLVWL